MPTLRAEKYDVVISLNVLNVRLKLTEKSFAISSRNNRLLPLLREVRAVNDVNMDQSFMVA